MVFLKVALVKILSESETTFSCEEEIRMSHKTTKSHPAKLIICECQEASE